MTTPSHTSRITSRFRGTGPAPRRQRGTALLLAVVSMLVVGAAMATLAVTVTGEGATASHRLHHAQALYAAESMRLTPGALDFAGSESYEFGGGNGLRVLAEYDENDFDQYQACVVDGGESDSCSPVDEHVRAYHRLEWLLVGNGDNGEETPWQAWNAWLDVCAKGDRNNEENTYNIVGNFDVCRGLLWEVLERHSGEMKVEDTIVLPFRGDLTFRGGSAQGLDEHKPFAEWNDTTVRVWVEGELGIKGAGAINNHGEVFGGDGDNKSLVKGNFTVTGTNNDGCDTWNLKCNYEEDNNDEEENNDWDPWDGEEPWWENNDDSADIGVPWRLVEP